MDTCRRLGNSANSTCLNQRPKTRPRPWMKSGLRIAGHCLWLQVAPGLLIAAFKLRPFSPGGYGQLRTGGEYRRGLQGVTWGYPGKTLWASFVPVLRQPNICQLFVNFSFETFLTILFEPSSNKWLLDPTSINNILTSKVLWPNSLISEPNCSS